MHSVSADKSPAVTVISDYYLSDSLCGCCRYCSNYSPQNLLSELVLNHSDVNSFFIILLLSLFLVHFFSIAPILLVSVLIEDTPLGQTVLIRKEDDK